jgi:MinD-like ATPase involved in chromosome partitioning or flagellar assembly
MTTIDEQVPARRLPGAARAAAFAEPAAETAPARRTAPTPPPAAVLPGQRTAARGLGSGSEVDATSAVSVSEVGVSEVSAPVPAGPPVLVSWTAPAAAEAGARWGRRRHWVKVLSLGLATPKPGREELAHRDNERLIRAATWPRSVRIAVVNPKGGSGKTPTAVCLAGAMARVRGGSVAVWDASDAAGTLADRTEGVQARCVAAVDDAPGDYAHPGTIAAVAATQTSSVDVLGSLTDREFTGDSVERVLWALDRTYRISVADTGNVPHSPAFEAVIAKADILVVPTTIEADSVNKALRLLHRLQRHGDLAQRAVVAVLRTGGPETPGLAGQIDTLFQTAGVGAIEHIPFDPAIAAGTAITYDQLTQASHVAWTRLAAATVSNITTTAN